MISVFASDSRGRRDHGWLDARHTFSFGDYHDPDRLGFRALRVINEDVIAPGKGFGLHPHQDMEILTYIISGELAHRDNLGHTAVIRPGRVQRMTAGTGITHAEFNPSTVAPVHLLQIWLQPDAAGQTPSYEEIESRAAAVPDQLHLIASGDAADEAATWHQDAKLYAAVLAKGTELTEKIDRGRHAWLQLIRGGMTLNGIPLHAGDGVAASDEPLLSIQAHEESEFLLFDLS